MRAQSRCLLFNSLHDLDQDGLLSIPELEAVYGLHHPQAKKSTPDAHMEAKRRAIMDKVLRQLDTNKDGESERSEGSECILMAPDFCRYCFERGIPGSGR